MTQSFMISHTFREECLKTYLLRNGNMQQQQLMSCSLFRDILRVSLATSCHLLLTSGLPLLFGHYSWIVLVFHLKIKQNCKTLTPFRKCYRKCIHIKFRKCQYIGKLSWHHSQATVCICLAKKKHWIL